MFQSSMTTVVPASPFLDYTGSLCGAYKKKWNQAATDLCPCSEIQTMYHIVDSCPLMKLNGGFSADDEAAALLTSYGS